MWLLRLTALAGLALVAGCGGRSQSEEELKRAESALRSALDAWKEGRPAAALKARTPAVEITDPDWASGHRLHGYEVRRCEAERGRNARCWVVLSLLARGGKRSEKEVVYELKAGDTVVIGRDPFN